MTSILPKFLRGVRTFPEGGFVGENDTPEGIPAPILDDRGHLLHAGQGELYRQQPRDMRLRLELNERLADLHAEEINLVEEINARLVKLQATRKAIRAIDAAGAVIVTEETPYKPVQSAVQNRVPAPSGNTRKLEHTAIVDGKPVTEEIEIDEADLAREIGDYAKAC